MKKDENYKEGQLDGDIATWFENGKKETVGKAEENLQIGKWTFWYENGNKESEGTYIRGQQDGLWRFWEENGKAKPNRKFKEGTEIHS